jgi:hypothetical protein
MIGEKDLGQYVEDVERVFILYVWEIIAVEQNNKCLIMNPINLMNLLISFSYIGGLNYKTENAFILYKLFILIWDP